MLSAEPQEVSGGRSVVVAFLMNAAITAMTGAAAVITGSATMYAETMHAAADTGNVVLLYVALRRSATPPDERHPLGYGQELYFWALLASGSMFVAGGVLSLREGLNELLHPTGVQAVHVGLAVLALGLLLDGRAWVTARDEARAETRRRGLSLRRTLKTTSDTTVPAVYFQELVALVAGVVAMAGLTAHAVTGSALPDAAAALVIGALQAWVAVHLAGRNRDLLTSHGVSPLAREQMTEAAEAVRGRMGGRGRRHRGGTAPGDRARPGRHGS